ncbi:MAG TPA: gamma-glutamyltransferase [Micropepsaceae bacterium]|nr:gamma-glutamyltransferase [Micropepsaceae bacterium]
MMKQIASAFARLSGAFGLAGWAALTVASASMPALAAGPLAQHHMIVAAEPDAAEAGLAMLRNGGSAVDALIAAQMVLTLEEPQSSGIGGGAYLIVADGTVLHAYDGREAAPASARPDMFLDKDGKPRRHDDAVPGGLSVGVPGAVRMLATAHAAHGKLPWAKLFEPAIRLAETGFKVPPRLAIELGEGGRGLAAMPAIKAHFLHPDGTPIKPGETWRNPELAQSLRRIADGGPDAFYKGAIAGEIADAVTKAPVNPGGMTVADLAGYQAKTRDPLCGLYRLYRVCSLPPSTSGGVTVLQILGLLQRFPSDQLHPNTLSAVHLVAEASKLAYADRAQWLGDPDFVPVPLAGLLDPAYVDARSRLIDPMRSMGMASAGMPPMKKAELRDFAPMRPQIEMGTSHLAAVDDNGEAVSMTTSVEAAFGAQIAAGGFLLNNQLTDFSFEPVIDGKPVANAPAPGKRPLSAMSPTIIFAPDGQFFAAVGSPGGRQIIAYVAQAVINLIDAKLSMPETAAAPRLVNMNGPTLIERGTALETLTPALTAMGDRVRAIPFDSGVNGIRRVNGGYEGGADPRREGVALGD